MQVLRDNLISFVLSSTFGVVVTILLFYFTSHPTTADTIRKRLKSAILKRLHEELGRTEAIVPEITNFLSQEFDIQQVKSIVMFGLWEPKKDVEWHRWIAIFEPQEPRLLDKLVGRPGFYELKSFAHMEVPSPDSLVPSKVEVLDFDGDGIPEVHVTLRSTWADSASIGPLILRKRQGCTWQFLALPAISVLTSQVLQGNSPHPDDATPHGRPIRCFGMKGASDGVVWSPLQDLKDTGVYEDNWILTHNGENIPFVTLRNGGSYQVRRHPIRDHVHLATVAFFADGHAVLSAHYAVVNFLILGDRVMTSDLLWNWGFPMVSKAPLRPIDIDLDSIAKAGIVAHIIGNTFFGYTEFERSMIDQHAWGVVTDQPPDPTAA